MLSDEKRKYIFNIYTFLLKLTLKIVLRGPSKGSIQSLQCKKYYHEFLILVFNISEMTKPI